MARPGLTIALLLTTPNLVDACQQWLQNTRYHSIVLSGPHQGQEQLDLVSTLEAQQEEIDAVVVEQHLLDASSRDQLLGRGLLFPAVVVREMKGHVGYHAEELHLAYDQQAQLGYTGDAAISRFLRQGRADGRSDDDGLASVDKLSRRLQERLGYLGVFYKRDPSRFLGSLPTEERRELLESLQRTYRDLPISYFSDPAASNEALESFVNTAFFSDLPITRTVDIHVDQIDEFWKQLRLEGHKSEFLQDYRLALLDVMAHLCEMYRRSIPPDIPLSGLASGRHRREADLPDAPEVSS